MREIRPSGSMSGNWNRGMVAILWHSQTKGRATVNTNSNLNRAPVLDSTNNPTAGDKVPYHGSASQAAQNLVTRRATAAASCGAGLGISGNLDRGGLNVPRGWCTL